MGDLRTFPLLTEGKVHKRCALGQIDTLGFSFPVQDFSVIGATMTVRDLGTESESRSWTRKLPGGGFLSTGIGGKAWVEASLPKRIDGENVEALDVSEALDVAHWAYREALGFCEPVGGRGRFEESKLVRVDPVRDFDGIGHVPELLNGLAAVPRSSVHKVRRFADAERNAAESLRVGPKAWGAQLYDKHAETKGVAEVGRLRYEGRFHHEQLTSKWAHKVGAVMRVVGDMSQEKVSALCSASFSRVAFDREVVGRATVAERVFGGNGLSERVQAQLWVYLTAPGAAGRMHRNTAYKYRELAAQLGVTMAAAESECAEMCVRLDYESGRELVRVA